MKKFTLILLASSLALSLQALRIQNIRIIERHILQQRQQFERQPHITTIQEMVDVLNRLDQKTLATLYKKAHQQPNGFYIATSRDITEVSTEQALVIRRILIADKIILTPVLEG